MTKAALRRQEHERQLREQQQRQQQIPMSERNTASVTTSDTIAPQPSVPHMEPPPPYDAPHLPESRDGSYNSSSDASRTGDPGCLTGGLGESSGCMNYNSGVRGPYYKVDGCMNYNSTSGCMNYDSEGGCLNYKSSGGCMNYGSTEGCMNYKVTEGGGCMNYQSRRGGCLQFGWR